MYYPLSNNKLRVAMTLIGWAAVFVFMPIVSHMSQLCQTVGHVCHSTRLMVACLFEQFALLTDFVEYFCYQVHMIYGLLGSIIINGRASEASTWIG